MKYWIYIKVLLTKLLIYKAGIYLAGIVLILGVVYGNIVGMGLAIVFYSVIIIAFTLRWYTRNVVYNYVLQNNVHLPRLWKRSPKLVDGYYYLDDIHEVAEKNGIEVQGRIKYRKISKAEYYFARFFWKWVDDDSNHDTMNGGDRTAEGMIYGSTFDLGDVRAEYPQWIWSESIAWFIRNTGYNANYMNEECAEGDDKYFYKRVTTKWFDWHFGYIPYSNSTRQGRMVWFTEDIGKVD